ncbi:NUDIX hydrolase [Tropicibacter oceani]|uniref:NUDIX hydrolase n=1 Tax=Tropicibacter oceani TaxID=3058420 RepID=A0ABY8QFD5_9RHOB|nr:NUDIX hydrolase [Tropicibacter oceani]WGW03319.1 NUDIX hydrolase [Tropicibacter oceani]
MFPVLWKQFIRPILIRPAQFQVAALCYRMAKSGPQILLITSRETRRWILPKGWPMKGLDTGGAARQEAWEEAGVKPTGKSPVKIGQYQYPKVTPGGVPVDTDVDVFAIEVDRLSKTFPEVDERTRQWFSPEEAAERVREADLGALITQFPDILPEPQTSDTEPKKSETRP